MLGTDTSKGTHHFAFRTFLQTCTLYFCPKAATLGRLFMSRPAVTSISYRDDPELTFPAVTVCEDKMRDSVKGSIAALRGENQERFKTRTMRKHSLEQARGTS